MHAFGVFFKDFFPSTVIWPIFFLMGQFLQTRHWDLADTQVRECSYRLFNVDFAFGELNLVQPDAFI